MNEEKIFLTPLARINVKGGDVLHAIKAGDGGYTTFGEAYFSWVSPGAVKAWKRHLRMTMNLMVPVGCVKFVFITECNGEFILDRVESVGAENYVRVTVEPGVWFGFQGVSDAPSLILNVSNIPHDPQEVERLALDDINYEWVRR